MGIIKNLLYKASNKAMMPLFKNQPIFPYYHLINNNEVKHIKHLYQYKTVNEFKKDLNFLLKAYKPLNPKHLINSKSPLKIPKNHFLLTFDDGLREIYNIIYPILKTNNLQAIFFINPNFIDNHDSLYKHDISIIIDHIILSKSNGEALRNVNLILNIDENSLIQETINSIKALKHTDKNKLNSIARLLDINIVSYIRNKKPYLSKTSIERMIDDGFFFGGHTMSHPNLHELDIENQIKEVIDSIKWLKFNFNIDYSFFAFPFWDKGISKKVFDSIFEYDNKAVIFGNSGIKKDFHSRVIQRFSLEKPSMKTQKVIISENLYKFYNKAIGKYNILRD